MLRWLASEAGTVKSIFSRDNGRGYCCRLPLAPLFMGLSCGVSMLRNAGRRCLPGTGFGWWQAEFRSAACQFAVSGAARSPLPRTCEKSSVSH